MPAATSLREQRDGWFARAIILLSDGERSGMSHITREAIEMARARGAIVYPSAPIPPRGSRRDKVRERIAKATGRRAFVPFQLNDVANAFVEIRMNCAASTLSYKPADLRMDGRFHSIEILLQPQGLRVRSRRGTSRQPNRPPAWRIFRPLLPGSWGIKPQFRIAFPQIPGDVKDYLERLPLWLPAD